MRRRSFLAGAAALAAGTVPTAGQAAPRRLFDGHFHVLEPAFPLVTNQGYVPPPFPLPTYLAEARPLGVVQGAIVSGSFQGFDQTYLRAALAHLGSGWVGVTQVQPDIPDAEITSLAGIGVCALRFNLYRGRVDGVADIIALARRAHAVAGWHAEIYADAATLKPHVAALSALPQISIDHLGMTEAGLPVVCDLVRAGAKVKATGFGRVHMNVPKALEMLATVSDSALVFGTDLPSTRANRPFEPSDIDLIARTLGATLASKVFWDNPRALYRVTAPA